jgi:hypothetical protein
MRERLLEEIVALTRKMLDSNDGLIKGECRHAIFQKLIELDELDARLACAYA